MHGLLQGDPPDAMLHAWENGHLDEEGGRADEVHGEPSVGPDTGGAKVDASTTADPDGGIGAAVLPGEAVQDVRPATRQAAGGGSRNPDVRRPVGGEERGVRTVVLGSTAETAGLHGMCGRLRIDG